MGISSDDVDDRSLSDVLPETDKRTIAHLQGKCEAKKAAKRRAAPELEKEVGRGRELHNEIGKERGFLEELHAGLLMVGTGGTMAKSVQDWTMIRPSNGARRGSL